MVSGSSNRGPTGPWPAKGIPTSGDWREQPVRESIQGALIAWALGEHST